MPAAIATFPGAPAHLTLDVSPTTETVRIAERFTKSADTTMTGRLNAGADPLGDPRSAHHTSPRRATTRTRPGLGASQSVRTRQVLCRLKRRRGSTLRQALLQIPDRPW